MKERKFNERTQIQRKNTYSTEEHIFNGRTHIQRKNADSIQRPTAPGKNRKVPSVKRGILFKFKGIYVSVKYAHLQHDGLTREACYGIIVDKANALIRGVAEDLVGGVFHTV